LFRGGKRGDGVRGQIPTPLSGKGVKGGRDHRKRGGGGVIVSREGVG